MTGRAMLQLIAIAAPTLLFGGLVAWFAVEHLIEKWLDRTESGGAR